MSDNKFLGDDRTIFNFNNDGVNVKTFYIGFIIYFILFVVLIPYLLIKNESWNILTAYIPNLDLLAAILGYHGGPPGLDIWTHLYNPAESTLIGYISSNIINYFALLGVTYIIAHYTFKTKDIYKGWARAFIMLPMTYLVPSNFIIYYMNKFGVYLHDGLQNYTMLHYLLVILFGAIIAILIILSEAFLIENYITHFVKLLRKLY